MLFLPRTGDLHRQIPLCLSGHLRHQPRIPDKCQYNRSCTVLVWCVWAGIACNGFVVDVVVRKNTVPCTVSSFVPCFESNIAVRHAEKLRLQRHSRPSVFVARGRCTALTTEGSVLCDIYFVESAKNSACPITILFYFPVQCHRMN